MNGPTRSGHQLALGADEVRAKASEDLAMLANLHAKPLERDVVISLWGNCYDGFLTLQMHSDEVRRARNLICLGLTDIPTYLDENSLGQVESAYRDIYVNGAIGVSPYEIAWGGRASLLETESTVGIGEWRQRFGYVHPESTGLSPDHIVSQLRFVSYLLAVDGAAAPLGDTLRYLDEHLLSWVSRFTQRVCERSKITWYQGLASLTTAYLQELRTLLGRLSTEECEEGVGLTAGRGESRDLSIKSGAPQASTQPAL